MSVSKITRFEAHAFFSKTRQHMNRTEAIALLRGGLAGLTEWNRQRESGIVPPSLCDADLRGVCFACDRPPMSPRLEVNLFGLDLRGANLEDANFVLANLQNVTLTSANLERCVFILVDLKRADLSGARMENSRFAAACLSRCKLFNINARLATFSLCQFDGARFQSADLRAACFDSCTFFRSDSGLKIPAVADFQDCRLIGSKFRNCLLTCASFHGANLSHSDLRGCNLSAATLVASDLRNANLIATDLRYADLSLTQLDGADLSDADVNDSVVAGVTFSSLKGLPKPPNTLSLDSARCVLLREKAAAEFFDLTKRNEPLILREIIWRSALRVSFDALTPREFEELCYLMIDADDAYTNVDYYGACGVDSGRDIVADEMTVTGQKRRCVFQCKRLKHNNSAAFCRSLESLIKGKIRCDVLVFITSQEVSAAIRDVVRERARHEGLHIGFWGPVKLASLLQRHEHVLQQYFGKSSEHVLREVQETLKQVKDDSGDEKRWRDRLEELIENVSTEISSSAAERDNLGASRDVRYGVRILVLLALVKLLHDAFAAYKGALDTYESDKTRLDEIGRQTREWVSKYAPGVGQLEQATIEDVGEVELKFRELVEAEGLGIAPMLHELGSQEFNGDETQIAVAHGVLDIIQDEGIRREVEWRGLLYLLKIRVVERLSTSRRVVSREFHSGRRDKCPKCGTRLAYDRTPPVVHLRSASRVGNFRRVL